MRFSFGNDSEPPASKPGVVNFKNKFPTGLVTVIAALLLISCGFSVKYETSDLESLTKFEIEKQPSPLGDVVDLLKHMLH